MLRKLSHVLTAAVACCTPAPLPAMTAGCQALSVAEALQAAGTTPGFLLDAVHVAPFLGLALAAELPPLAMPDGVLVMAPRAAPLLVLLTRGSCVVGAFEIEREPVWRALRETIGPAV
ncbi:hypothetical protein SH611_03100 [Geminicoccaceae bacterium 1502E]|nr:hypothetical protein [Geminicoccaceae bacterium 1502E]